MRNELKNFNWHLYGLRIDDYDYTFSILKELLKDRKKILKIENKRIDKKNNQLKKNKLPYDDTGEEISDIAYYSFIRHIFLWEFAIWRLQGIFEGILNQEFIKTSKLRGLKSKLDYINSLGFKINKTDYDEILEWAKLRNALSHFPPEQFHPAQVTENDVKQYLKLLKRVTRKLLNQKKVNKRKYNFSQS